MQACGFLMACALLLGNKARHKGRGLQRQLSQKPPPSIHYHPILVGLLVLGRNKRGREKERMAPYAAEPVPPFYKQRKDGPLHHVSPSPRESRNERGQGGSRILCLVLLMRVDRLVL
eukprot:1138736-Pelagomonas_calceolata.AAC.5